MSHFLAVTLGHNSSAVFYDSETHRVIGFEEERLSGIKSDSSFPEASLNTIFEILEEAGTPVQLEQVYVSHWFDNFDPKVSNKYWNADYFSGDNVEIVQMDHHSAHAWSAIAFYEEQYRPLRICDVLVVDGFGNNQNCISLFEYDAHGNALTTKRRVFGYSASLGLLYQWAAEVVGMDGMNDVYKFLGYRIHIDPALRPELDHVALALSDTYFNKIVHPDRSVPPLNWNAQGQVISMVDFEHAKNVVKNLLTLVVPPGRDNMGYVVQAILENVILKLIDQWLPKDPTRPLLVAGGCFYNVRLNMLINERIPGPFCPMPVAGDQGCAFGAIRYAALNCHGLMKSLCIGPRPTIESDELVEGPARFVHSTRGSTALPSMIAKLLLNNVIVNVVQDGMEFGPRALCHTSTLCLPTTENVDLINHMNKRNTVMPMAPVMLRHWAERLFDHRDLANVIGGEQFMIMALRYKEGVVEEHNIYGAAHPELDGGYTGRPQVVDRPHNPLMYGILQEGNFPCLVNTSLNYHGEPIVYSHFDAVELHGRWLIALQELGVSSEKLVTIWVS
jgi:carbamoyltransferase